MMAAGVDAVPVFAEKGNAWCVADGGFNDVGAGPVIGADVAVEAETEQGFGLIGITGAIGDAVEDGAGFGAGERVFRAESAIFVATDPAKGSGFGNSLSGPVISGHVSETFTGGNVVGEINEDRYKFGTSDGIVWPEGIAVARKTKAANSANGFGEPIAVADIGVGAGARPAVRIGKEPVKEGHSLSTGDSAAWAHAAIWVASNVRNMIT